MEKQLLRQSGIIAVIITFSVLAFWFGFSKLSLGAYNEKNLTRQFLAEDSEVFKTIVIEVGTDTVARIIVGTSSMVRTGTSSYQYQPRIQYDGTTGLWTFKNSVGTETTAFGTLTADYVAAEIGSTAANYVLQNNGSSSGQLVTSPTFAGQGTLAATFNANGANISPTEVGYLDGMSENINDKLATVSSSIADHTHTGSDGTTQIAHNDVAGIGTNSHATIDTYMTSEASATRVSTAIGSISINAHSDVDINMSNENDFVKIVGGRLVAGSSSSTVVFSAVTGSVTDNASLVTWGHNTVITGLSGGTTTSGKALYFSANETLAVASWLGTPTAAIGFSNGTVGEVIVSGKVTGLGGLIAGRFYLLGENGSIVANGTTTINYIIQSVLYAIGTDTGIVNIDRFVENQ